MLRDVLQGVANLSPCQTQGPVRPVWIDPLWVPVTDNGAGNFLCLDLHPAEGGHYGQIIEYLHDTPIRTVVAGSFADWLSTVADDMEVGDYTITNLGWPERAD
jgi:cell wall assembly regulator SMI1